MKKKILFMAINMNIGGTEKALLNMLLEIPKEKYDVTLLLLEKTGGFLNQVPDHVKIEVLKEFEELKPLINQPLFWSSVRYLKQGRVASSFKMSFFYFASKIAKTNYPFLRSITRKTKSLEYEYDVAVAYAGPMDFISLFVANKIQANKKVQWIHFDVTKIGFDHKVALSVYKKFDKIFTVSDEGRLKLINTLPVIENKAESFINLVSPQLVKNMAEKESGFADDFQGKRILTVGRLSQEKGQELAIRALARLIKEGYNVRWYFIGDGPARKDYEDLVKKYGLEKNLILLGTKLNPYCYMKQCDFYVQTSRHEGYCITLTEAKCFNNPIVTTNFTGANEQIKDKENGLIVNYDEEDMFLAIKQLLDNDLLRKSIRRNLEIRKSEKINDIEKLYKLF
jgi:glycosyltransferase involved in cell wall biosynthesis